MVSRCPRLHLLPNYSKNSLYLLSRYKEYYLPTYLHTYLLALPISPLYVQGILHTYLLPPYPPYISSLGTRVPTLPISHYLSLSLLSRYKGTRELVHCEKYSLSENADGYCSLTVHDVYGEDADEYVAKVTNKAGSRSSRADLVIRC